MASAVIDLPGELHQEDLPDFILVRTDEVDEGDRLRSVDPVWAKALGALMAREGQQTPIQVCRLPGRDRWTLVVGAHRRAGAEAAGIEFLRAEIVGASRDSRRLREVSENLWRRDLAPIDRAAFIAELVQIKRAQAGLQSAAFRDASVKKAVRAEADETMETISNVYGWTDAVGEQLGLTGRTVRNDLMLYRGLPASLVERLRVARHPILTNAAQLRALAKLEPTLRERVADKLLGVVVNGKTVTTVAAALGLAGGGKPPADPGAKRLSAFVGAFARMSLTEKKGALAQLGGMLPAGFRLAQGDPPRAAFSPQHAEYREQTLAAIDVMRELVEGILEDEIVDGERWSALSRASGELQLARLTVAGDGFALGTAA